MGCPEGSRKGPQSTVPVNSGDHSEQRAGWPPSARRQEGRGRGRGEPGRRPEPRHPREGHWAVLCLSFPPELDSPEPPPLGAVPFPRHSRVTWENASQAPDGMALHRRRLVPWVLAPRALRGRPAPPHWGFCREWTGSAHAAQPALRPGQHLRPAWPEGAATRRSDPSGACPQASCPASPRSLGTASAGLREGTWAGD